MAAGDVGAAGVAGATAGAPGLAREVSEVPEMTTGADGGEIEETWAVPEPAGWLVTAAEVDPAATGGLTLLACN